METKKKVGIMGGTFNPIHLGHMLVAENAYETFDLDEILFVPSGESYMKENVLDAKTRITMTGVAIEDNSHFALSTIEVDRGGNSYSYETIEELKKHNPNTEYYFIVGADSLMNMEKWKNPEKIFNEVTILVAVRMGCTKDQLIEKIEELKEKFKGAKFFILPINTVDISSTSIRDKVRKGKSIRYMVHYKVIEYIKKNHIYLEDNEER